MGLFTNSGGGANRVVIVSPENVLRFLAEPGFAASGFDVTLAAVDQRTGRTGEGRALGRSREFGYFSIPALTGNPDNPEVFVKVLDARTVNGEYWVFYGGLTDLEYTLTVRHNPTARVKNFFKEGEAPAEASIRPGSAGRRRPRHARPYRRRFRPHRPPAGPRSSRSR